MESYITLSQLNDFIFCPRSIYFHNLYARYNDYTYKQTPQILGKLNHEKIDKSEYSTRKDVLQGLSIFCEKYNIAGKLDIFEIKSGKLIERKTKVEKIYDGYRYQLYGQLFCLQEMGYEVKEICVHSLSDNKRYKINLPKEKEIAEFEQHLGAIRDFNLNAEFSQNAEKCKKCIYAQLCDYNLNQNAC